MKYTISKKIIHETIHCEKGFECQKENWQPCEKIIGENLEFKNRGIILSACNIYCPYKVKSDNHSYCTCPTRIEIFRTYKI